MGVRILTGSEPGYAADRACLFDSVTDWAFGPVFYAGEHIPADAGEMADAFLQWCDEDWPGVDVRTIPDNRLEHLYAQFLDEIDKPQEETQ